MAMTWSTPATRAVATLMITVLVLPVSLLLCSMLGMATEWIEEVEQNRTRAAAKQQV